MKAELVERRSGVKIRGDISAALRQTAIYLAILGNRFSETVKLEYEEAKHQGLPIVIFEIISSRKDIRKREPRLLNLINRIKRVDDVRVTSFAVHPSRPSGRASLDPRNRATVEIITQRLANAVAELVRENLDIRRIVNPQ